MISYGVLKKTVLAAALSSALGLTGCGGDSSTTVEDADKFGALTGTAAKGIVIGGLVTASELDDAGAVVREIGTAVTDETGKYSIPVNNEYSGGPVKVSIEATNDTEMVCDVHSDADNACEFGERVALSSGFQMDAVLPEVSGTEDISLPITPLTHMAASRALSARSGITKESVNNAISEVNQITGVNILNIEPIDITNTDDTTAASAEQKTYAAFIAGIGRIAMENASGLNEGMNAVAESFADGKLEASEAVTPANIIAAVKAEAEKSELDVTQAMASLESRVSEDGSLDPEPLDVGIDDIARGKALVSDVRTWLTSLAQYEDPMEAFAGDIELAGELFDQEVESLIELYDSVMETVVNTLGEKPADELVGTHQIVVFEGTDQETTVTATLSNTGVDGGLVIDIPEKEITNTGITTAFSITTNLPEDTLEETEFSLSKADIKVSGEVASNTASISLDQVHVTAQTIEAVTVNSTIDAEPVYKAGTFAGDFTIKRTETNNGTPVDYSFSGNSSIELVKLNRAGENHSVSLKQIKIDGNISASDGRSLSAKLQLDVNNSADFDTLAFADHDSEMWVHEYKEGDVFGLYSSSELLPQGLSNPFHIEYSSYNNQTCHYGQLPDSNEGSGEVCLSGDTYGVANQFGNAITATHPGVEGVNGLHVSSWSQENGEFFTTEYSAQVSFPDFETASNYLKATITAEVALELDNLDSTKVIATADRTGLENGELSLSFIHKDIERFKVNMTAAGDEVDGDVTFKNADGVSMIIKPDQTRDIGVIETNGNVVGTIEEREDAMVIVWSDQTIETLQ